MMLPATEPEKPRESEGLPDKIEWRVHPLTESFPRSALLFAIIILTCVGVWYWLPSGGIVLLAALVLVGMTSQFLFPTSFRMTKDGIETRFLGIRNYRAWGEFKSFYPDKTGVQLGTFSRPNRLDSFRGLSVRFGRGNRDEVLRYLDDRIKRGKPDKDEAKPEG
jgi:hypothetical protein